MNYTQGGEELANRVDIEKLLTLPRYAGGHDEQMVALIKGATLLGHWNENDYQGQVATCVKLPDGRVAIYNDYYGSCSGCDCWEDAEDDEVRKLCHDLAFGAYVFEDITSALQFLNQEFDYSTAPPQWYEWFGGQNPAKNLSEAIVKLAQEGDDD